MGCAELNNPRRTRGESKNNKIIKETGTAEVHGEEWSSPLWVRASLQQSPSLNGGSDGYSLLPPPHTHSHRLSLLTYYATIYLRGAIKRCVDNRTVLIRSVFAGSLGISGEMEGLVEEVSIVDESGEDSAPSWPFAQLHLRHWSLLSSWRAFLLFVLLFVPCWAWNAARRSPALTARFITAAVWR